jgi:bifunctional UDP-N-acetylglucosamine pyrophosphorylase/glucosamine-1-phosphate N-acetyltransferase
VFGRIAVVVGPDMDRWPALAAPHAVMVQHERLGTAHAALQAADAFGDGEVAVLFADNPLIEPATLRRLLDRRAHQGAGLALMAMRPADPARYGRLMTRDGNVARIVEWADATEAERAIDLCNAGALCGPAARVLPWLRAIRADNAKGEYYLTDLVGAGRGGRPARGPPWRRRKPNCAASIRAPNWPPPRPCCSRRCAPRRWKAAPR